MPHHHLALPTRCSNLKLAVLLTLFSAIAVNSQERFDVQSGGTITDLTPAHPDEAWYPKTAAEIECFIDVGIKAGFFGDSPVALSGKEKGFDEAIEAATCGAIAGFSQPIYFTHLTIRHLTESKLIYEKETEYIIGYSVYRILQEIISRKDQNPVILVEGLSEDLSVASPSVQQYFKDYNELIFARFFPDRTLPARYEDLNLMQRQLLPSFFPQTTLFAAAHYFTEGKIEHFYKSQPSDKYYTAVEASVRAGKPEYRFTTRERMAIECAWQAVSKHSHSKSIGEVLMIFGATHDFRRHLQEDSIVEGYSRLPCHIPTPNQATNRAIGEQCLEFQKLGTKKEKDAFVWEAAAKSKPPQSKWSGHKKPHR
jgi:hypothetical protein